MMATAASAKVAKVSRTALERVAMRSVFMVASRKRSETAKMRPAWSRLRPEGLERVDTAQRIDEMIGHTLEFTVPLRGVIFGGVSDHNHIQDDEREAGKRDEGRNQIERNHGDEQDQRHDADRGHLRNDEGYVGGDVLGSPRWRNLPRRQIRAGRQVQARLRRRLEAATPAMNRPVGRRIGRACGLARRE